MLMITRYPTHVTTLTYIHPQFGNSIFCHVETNDGVTKWLAPEGLVGTLVAG